jgi:hypothetical protein
MPTQLHIFLFLLAGNYAVSAQTTFLFQIPDATITADKITKGDGDTYGLGDWRCTFKASLDGSTLKVTGDIVFTEKANDFSTIVGSFQQNYAVDVLEKCKQCTILIDEPMGSVSGLNVGARGYRWYRGQGLIRKAKIQTDVFGADEGHIGGIIRFAPIKLVVHCDYAFDNAVLKEP